MGTHTKKTYVENNSRFIETPKPGKVVDSSDQATGMKSDSQLHKAAVDEDNGKC